MPEQIKVEHIQLNNATIAQLFKLPQQMIDYLWERIDIVKKKQVCVKKDLAGHISHSYKLDDPQNVVIRNLYDIVFNQVDNPIMFEYMNKEVENIYKRSGLVNVMLEPYLSGLWVNFQKKGEFQPIHDHSGMFSFVIWMDIPYHSKDEAKLPFAKSNSKDPTGGNFSFVTSDDTSRRVSDYIIQMSPEMNGYCCFFPSDLCHQVYPFYTSDKDRISISGNISYRSTKPNPPPIYQFPFHMSGT
jgi:RNAse (barnase) inhibitor barstar